MIDYSQALKAWADELRQVHLPRWHELPTLSLYMDQVLVYVNDVLIFLKVGDTTGRGKHDERLLTSAMINNYVKQRLLPKPTKKRYQREHLACLIVYGLLKQVLPLVDIQKGIFLQLALCDRDLERAYDMFCEQVEASLACVSDLTCGRTTAGADYGEMPLSILGTSMASLSLATKLIAQKVLSLNAQQDETGYDIETALGPQR